MLEISQSRNSMNLVGSWLYYKKIAITSKRVSDSVNTAQTKQV